MTENSETPFSIDGIESLFRDYSNSLLWSLRRRGDISHSHAEEIAQEAWMKLHERVSNPDSPPIFWPKSWLLTTAWSIYLKTVKREERKVNYPTLGGQDHELTSEEERMVLDLFRALPERQRTAFCLKYDDYETAEIAEIMGASSATVRSHIRFARTNLIEALKKLEREGKRMNNETSGSVTYDHTRRQS